jgi:hypothetical protein
MKGMTSMDLAPALAAAQARSAQQGSRARSEAGTSNPGGFGTALNDAMSNEAASAGPRSSAPGAKAPRSTAAGADAPGRGPAGAAKKRPADASADAVPAAAQDTVPASAQGIAPAVARDNASAAANSSAPAADASTLAASALFVAGIQPAPAAGPADAATAIQATVALPGGAQTAISTTQSLADPRLALQAGATAVPAAGLDAAAALPVPGGPAAGHESGAKAAGGPTATPNSPLPGAVVLPPAGAGHRCRRRPGPGSGCNSRGPGRGHCATHSPRSDGSPGSGDRDGGARRSRDDGHDQRRR